MVLLIIITVLLILLLGNESEGRVVFLNQELSSKKLSAHCLHKLFETYKDGFGYCPRGGSLKIKLQLLPSASSSSPPSGIGIFALWHKGLMDDYKFYKILDATTCSFPTMFQIEFQGDLDITIPIEYGGYMLPVLIDMSINETFANLKGEMTYLNNDDLSHLSYEQHYVFAIFTVSLGVYVLCGIYIYYFRQTVYQQRNFILDYLAFIVFLNIIASIWEMVFFYQLKMVGFLPSFIIICRNVATILSYYSLIFLLFLISIGFGVTRSTLSPGEQKISFLLFAVLISTDLLNPTNPQIPIHNPLQYQFFLPLGLTYMNFRSALRRELLQGVGAKLFRSCKHAISHWYYYSFFFHICYWLIVSWRFQWVSIVRIL